MNARSYQHRKGGAAGYAVTRRCRERAARTGSDAAHWQRSGFPSPKIQTSRATYANSRGRNVANLLRKFEVEPRVIRMGLATPRSYLREDLHDAWIRYLTPLGRSPIGAATSATNATFDHEAAAERAAIEGEPLSENAVDYPRASRGA